MIRSRVRSCTVSLGRQSLSVVSLKAETVVRLHLVRSLGYVLTGKALLTLDKLLLMKLLGEGGYEKGQSM